MWCPPAVATGHLLGTSGKAGCQERKQQLHSPQIKLCLETAFPHLGKRTSPATGLLALLDPVVALDAVYNPNLQEQIRSRAKPILWGHHDPS